MSIKIVIADDHEMIRDGVKVLLQNLSEFEVVGEASNGKEVLALLKDIIPDIILLDINMPVMDGLECLSKVHEKYPEVNIVMFTMYANEEMIINSLEAGARGYLLKSANKDEIITAIRACNNGDSYYSSGIVSTLSKIIAQQKSLPFKAHEKIDLSEREKEIIRLISNEYTIKEIASSLGISFKTVETHRDRIMQKMGVRNSAGLVVYAIKNGLVE